MTNLGYVPGFTFNKPVHHLLDYGDCQLKRKENKGRNLK